MTMRSWSLTISRRPPTQDGRVNAGTCAETYGERVRRLPFHMRHLGFASFGAAALVVVAGLGCGAGQSSGLGLVATSSSVLATRCGSDLDDPRFSDSGSRIQCAEFSLVGGRVCGLDGVGKC